MRALYFKLSGKTAFFRKPEVNSYAYFTYNNIHKVALLGLLGAVIGLGGYNQQGSDEQYPEFYERLKDLKVSILPSLESKGYYSKKIHEFNNSVGYASKEEGGNLIVREQWLENPCWEIFLMDDGSSGFIKVREYLHAKKCEYIPYLGKNDHIAKIENVKDIELEGCSSCFIDSLFPSKNTVYGRRSRDENSFIFKEVSPVRLDDKLNFYEYMELAMTNREIRNISEIPDVYKCGDHIIAFF